VTYRFIRYPFFSSRLQTVLNAAVRPISVRKSEHITLVLRELPVCSGENSISGCVFWRFAAFMAQRRRRRTLLAVQSTPCRPCQRSSSSSFFISPHCSTSQMRPIATVVLTYSYPFSALTLLVGHQERHPACKKTEWWSAGVHGYLPGVRCRLAYGPADATATHCLLLQ